VSQPGHVVRLLLTCINTDLCEVSFEPGGSILQLRHGDSYTVEVRGEGNGIVEVSFEPEGIIIGSWRGAEITVWDRAGGVVKI